MFRLLKWIWSLRRCWRRGPAMGKVPCSGHRSSGATNTKSRKEKKIKVNDWGSFGTYGKKEASKKYKRLHKEILKKLVIKPKSRGSMASVETSNYTAEVWSRHCTETWQTSLEGKPALLSQQKTVTSIWKRIDPRLIGRVHKKTFWRSQRGLRCNEAQLCWST